MNNRKRQRDTTTDDSDDQQIVNKLQRTSSCLITSINKDKYAITSFEDFSNELFYEVFDYLSPHHIYQGFVNLNTRFQNLLFYVNIPIKMDNISSSSKATFEHYYTEFIVPMQHRMKKLHISDPFTIEYIFSITENISIYSQLQKLSLENIESSYLENLLNRLIILPNLSSLTVNVSCGADKINIYKQIFQLPILKYCKLVFQETTSPVSLTISTNLSSPIEQLIIKDNYSLNNIDSILSYLPQLHRFLITTRCEEVILERPIVVLILLKNLTQISFTLDRLQSDDIQQFLKKYSHQIQLLHFFTYTTQANLDIEASTKSMSSYLRRSKMIQLSDFSGIDCYHILELYQSLYNRCNLLACDMRQWFFTHETMSEECLHKILCSFQAYRRQDYINPYSSDSHKHKCRINNVLHSVCHVTIENENTIVYEKSFPNVTELTLSMTCNNYTNWLSNNEFHKIIPIARITKLNIDNKHKNFYQVLDILVQIPNIHTLTLTSLEIIGRNISSIEEHQTFRLISEQNKIKNVMITYTYTLKTIQMLIKLCPKLQHLTLTIVPRSLEATIRFLLSENNQIPCQVSSLCVLNAYEPWIKKMKNIIQSKRPLNDYSLKIFNQKFYLWW